MRSEQERYYGYNSGCHHIRHRESLETDSAREYCNNFTMVGELRREEYHRYKSEQRAELIGKIWQIIPIIFKYGLAQRRIDNGIETLNYVEHYHNGYQEHQRKHKCAKKRANNIAVEYFHMECTRTLAFAASAKSLCSLL